eukprot:11019870-Ditylum_brightwellii.AAC.1
MGTMRELIKYIGWLINTREFTIALLQEKAANWLNLLDTLITNRRSSFKELESVIEDLNLWKGFIRHAAEGISMNNVVYQAADIAVWSNASFHGIGSYSLNGDTWRWQLPAKLIG